MTIKREVRSFIGREFRVEVEADGKRYLTGYAAIFNSPSQDLGGWIEKIKPGAFQRAIADKQDIRHLKNHDANFVLGRTKAGTMELSEDSVGLRFKTALPNTSYAADLIESVERGDIDECSFAFSVNGREGQSWGKEGDVQVRYLNDVDMFDISVVTYPAYSGTSASMTTRSMFPDGVPESISEHVTLPPVVASGENPSADENSLTCECECPECLRGDCGACTNQDCDDENCLDCPMQNAAKAMARAATDWSRNLASHASLAIRLRDMADKRERLQLAAATVPMERRAAENQDGVLELFMYGDIGEDCWGEGITAQNTKMQIDSAGPHDRIRVRINSFGGDAFEGIAICNLLKSRGKPIEVCVDALAASAASVIAMAADPGKLFMGNNAMLMIHNASTSVYGYASDLRKTADVLDKISTAVAQTYVDRCKIPMDKVKGIMDSETWMTAQECVEGGFADAVAQEYEERSAELAVESAAVVRSSRAKLTFKNVPAKFMIAADNLEETEERERIKLRTATALAQ